MKRFMTKKVAVVGVAVVATLGIAGGAVAFFTATGHSTGTGSVGTATWTVSDVAYSSGATPLFPGQSAQTWDFTITNSSGGEQNLQDVTVAVTDSGALALHTCPLTAFDIDGLDTTGGSSDTFNAGNGMTLTDWNSNSVSSPLAASYEVPAGDAVTGTFTLEMNDDNQSGTATNQDGCQGASPVFTFTAS